MSNFYTDVIMKSPVYHSTKIQNSIDLLEPVTRAAVLAILADAAKLDMPMMVFETYRSIERQQLLYEQHATQLRNVGVHHYAVGCDIVKNIDGQPSWKGSFDLLGVLARKHGLISGLNWNLPGPTTFVDGCHVQRIAVSDQAKLFNGTFYPSETYDPYL